jgi:hypothetical protein
MANSPDKKPPPKGPSKDPDEKFRLLPDPKRKKSREGVNATGEFTEISPDEKKRR